MKEQRTKNPAAVALGKLGGKASRGWVRKLPPAERARIMREVVGARWAKRRAAQGLEPEPDPGAEAEALYARLHGPPSEG